MRVVTRTNHIVTKSTGSMAPAPGTGRSLAASSSRTRASFWRARARSHSSDIGNLPHGVAQPLLHATAIPIHELADAAFVRLTERPGFEQRRVNANLVLLHDPAVLLVGSKPDAREILKFV